MKIKVNILDIPEYTSNIGDLFSVCETGTSWYMNDNKPYEKYIILKLLKKDKQECSQKNIVNYVVYMIARVVAYMGQRVLLFLIFLKNRQIKFM